MSCSSSFTSPPLCLDISSIGNDKFVVGFLFYYCIKFLLCHYLCLLLAVDNDCFYLFSAKCSNFLLFHWSLFNFSKSFSYGYPKSFFFFFKIHFKNSKLIDNCCVPKFTETNQTNRIIQVNRILLKRNKRFLLQCYSDERKSTGILYNYFINPNKKGWEKNGVSFLDMI